MALCVNLPEGSGLGIFLERVRNARAICWHSGEVDPNNSLVCSSFVGFAPQPLRTFAGLTLKKLNVHSF